MTLDANHVLLIDEASYPLVRNVTIKLKADLIGTRLEIENPLADRACGCGESFILSNNQTEN
jgi:Fe-S cluster assembly iron-binding protein IscA